MRATDWLKASPPVLLAVGLLLVVLSRGSRNPEFVPFAVIFGFIPPFVIGAVTIWILGKFRHARSGRIWQAMAASRMDGTRFLFFVYPRTAHDFQRIGLQTKPAYATYPPVGVIFGSDISFWEEGQDEPRMRIPYSRVEGVELTSMQSGVRSFPAVCLNLTDPTRPPEDVRRRTQLNLSLRHSDHKSMSEADHMRLIQELTSRLVRI